MQYFVLRRVALIVPTLLGVSLAIFIIMRVIPGDVATYIATRGGEGNASPEQIQALRVKLGLTDPLPVQYVKFVGGLVKLDAGDSLWTGRPVIGEISSRIPLTLELAFLSVLVSVTVAVPLGVIAALHRNTWVDYLLRVISISGLAIPNFWLGVLIILILSIYFAWIPPLGYANFFSDPVRNLQQMIWPAVALGFRLAAIVSRMTRSSMLEVAREDFVRTARAKGLRDQVIVYRHLLKNALLPVVTLIGLQLSGLLAGTVIMETIFTLPGIGRLLIDGINHRDYPIVQTIVVLLAVMFASVNLLVDVMYAWLNPRIRYS